MVAKCYKLGIRQLETKRSVMRATKEKSGQMVCPSLSNKVSGTLKQMCRWDDHTLMVYPDL
jgi:hypothetical protein